MDTYVGCQFIENPYLVDKVPVRTHRKKRIRKKWLKRYGTKYIPSTKIFMGTSTLMKGFAHAHPETIARILQKVVNQNG